MASWRELIVVVGSIAYRLGHWLWLDKKVGEDRIGRGLA